MRLNDFFKTERAIKHLAEDVGMTGKLPDTPDMKYMAKLKDLFKVDADTPQKAVSTVIHMIMDRPASRTTKIYMNDVLQGAGKAGIRIEPGLRQHAEQYLDEGVMPSIKPITEDIDVDGISTLNGVTYDQLAGAGATAYNREIETFGVGVLMKPSAYLKMVLPLRGNEPTSEVSAAVGEEKPIASPWLALKFGEQDGLRCVEGTHVLSHQGRHRAKAILEKYGDVDMLVHVIYVGARPKNITIETLQELNKGMVNESGMFINGPFWTAVV